MAPWSNRGFAAKRSGSGLWYRDPDRPDRPDAPPTPRGRRESNTLSVGFRALGFGVLVPPYPYLRNPLPLDTGGLEAQAAVDPQREVFETIAIKAKKTDIDVRFCALVWLPYWATSRGVEPAWR